MPHHDFDPTVEESVNAFAIRFEGHRSCIKRTSCPRLSDLDYPSVSTISTQWTTAIHCSLMILTMAMCRTSVIVRLLRMLRRPVALSRSLENKFPIVHIQTVIIRP